MRSTASAEHCHASCHVRAVGVMGNGRTRTLRLYTDGFLRDIYITAG